MQFGLPELLIILALLAILFGTRGLKFINQKRKQQKGQVKSAPAASKVTTSSSKATSESPSVVISSTDAKKNNKDEADPTKTLKYAGIAFTFIGVILILATIYFPELSKYAILFYIAGGLIAGIGVVSLIMLFVLKKK
jgi:hypothetical protein